MWICDPYLLTYVCKPCKIWGWKIWQRYRIQYRFRRLSKRNDFIYYNCNINGSGVYSGDGHCKVPLQIKRSEPHKKNHKIAKHKFKSNSKSKLFKTKVKQRITRQSNFQPHLDTIPEVHSVLSTKYELHCAVNPEHKYFCKKSTDKKNSLTESTLPFNTRTLPRVNTANRSEVSSTSQILDIGNSKISTSTPSIRNCTGVTTKADQETTTEIEEYEIDRTLDMYKQANSKPATDSKYAEMFENRLPSIANCKIEQHEENSIRNSRGCSSSLKQSRFISDDSKKYPLKSNTNHAIDNQIDLQITKIIPQPRPKQTSREKYNKKEHKTKANDCRYKHNRVDSYENRYKSTSREVKPTELLGVMTPTKLEKNTTNNLPNPANSRSDSTRANYNHLDRTCSTPELKCETMRFSESHRNKILYVLPITQLPEIKENLQVVIVHLDPMVSRYLKPYEEECVNFEQDDTSCKQYILETKPKELEAFSRTEQKQKVRTKRTSIETTNDTGGKIQYKNNRKQSDTNNCNKKTKTKDEPIQTDMHYPGNYYNNSSRNADLYRYPFVQTFTIERNKDFDAEETTFLDISCQTGPNNLHERSLYSPESIFRPHVGTKIDNIDIEELENNKNFVIFTPHTNYNNIIPEEKIYHYQQTKKNEPRFLIQHSNMGKLDNNKYSKACNTITIDDFDESNTFSSQTYPFSKNIVYQKPRSRSLDNSNTHVHQNDFVYAKYLNLEDSSTTNNEFEWRSEENNNRQIGSRGERRDSSNVHFKSRTASPEKLSDKGIEENASPNIQTMYEINNHSPKYMVYYESNVYQKHEEQGRAQTDYNCVCTEPNSASLQRKLQDTKSRIEICPYLPLMQDQWIQTSISKENVDYLNNEVAEYVIAEDQSSQTINRTCCNCLMKETLPINTEDGACQYNTPIHKAIEYNKNECRYFKTFKSGITKVASTYVASTFLDPDNADTFKQEETAKLDVTKATDSRATSTSSSRICLSKHINVNNLGNPKIDTSTTSATYSQWGGTKLHKKDPKGAATSYNPELSSNNSNTIKVTPASKNDQNIFKRSNGKEEQIYCSCKKCCTERAELSKVIEKNAGDSKSRKYANKRDKLKVCFNPRNIEEKMPSRASKESEDQFPRSSNSRTSKESDQFPRSNNKILTNQTEIPKYGTFVQTHEMGKCSTQSDIDRRSLDCESTDYYKLNQSKMNKYSEQNRTENFTLNKVLELNICKYDLTTKNETKESVENGDFEIVTNSLSSKLQIKNNDNVDSGTNITQTITPQVEINAVRDSGKKKSKTKVSSKRPKSM